MTRYHMTIAWQPKAHTKRNRIPAFIIAMFLCIPFGGRLPDTHGGDPADAVDPFIGVLDDESNCVIGPQLPFGSINPSPQTPSGSHDGYSPREPIRGFGQLHASGTGWGKYGQIFVSPQIGLSTGERDHDSPKADETARSYEYRVRLTRYGITAECTPSRHSAIYRFTFPRSDSANILFDITHNIPLDIAPFVGGKVTAGEVGIDTAGGCTVTGWGTYAGGFGEGEYQVFFRAEVNRAPKGYGCWLNGTVIPSGRAGRITGVNDRVGAYLAFSTAEEEQVLMKIAVSFKSTATAEHWLRTEIPAWDYEGVKESAKKEWNSALGKIEVEGGTDTLRTLFYTALYHAMLMPRDRTGDMKGFGESDPLWDDEYAVWDTWRTLFPLMSIINPAMVRGNINSFITRFRKNGEVKDTFVAGRDMFEEQGGNDVDNVIADASACGIGGLDWNAAYAIVKHDADSGRTGWVGWAGSEDSSAGRWTPEAYRAQGWIPAGIMSCSQTLEYAYNDFCAGTMAERMGRSGDAVTYMRRSGMWRALWNPDASSEGFNGFIVPRTPAGSWVAIDPKKNPGSWKEYFYEGNSWTYSYFVPHQFPELIGLCGGKETYVRRLEFALEHGLIDYSNEPSFFAIPSLHFAGRPERAAFWMHALMRTGYTLRGYPGNDDSGAMSSWFVFAAMGIFAIAGQDLCTIHGPSFARVTIHMEGGKTIIIRAEGASGKNIYVRSLRVNGKEWNTPFIRRTELGAGAELDFVMGDRPSPWGR